MKAAEKAYNVLRSGIIEGSFPPGSRITEQEVAAEAEVSRTPVREAMRRLQAEGLLEFAPHQSPMVRAWSDADAEEIFELRTLLEAHAAERAASHAISDEIDQLRTLAEAQQVEVEDQRVGYLERIADLNEQFHKTLYKAAGSERLQSILGSLADAPLVFEVFRDYSLGELRRSALHHLEIVHAIQAGDGNWAASVMRSHVRAARQTFETMAAHKADRK
jgi:DNA-binding GntR family transcriptional regulator